MTRTTALLTALLVTGPGAAAPAVIEEGVLDRIQIETASLPAKAPLVIRRFPAGDASAGTAEKGDNEQRMEAVRVMRNEGPRILAESILKNVDPNHFASVTESEEGPPEKALVLEGRFVLIDPGSRAKRFWAGFGAGKSGVGVEGTVKDPQGRVLASFSHRRHSGIGVGGGDYVKFLSDDTRDVGHDIAVFLNRWAAGGDLTKEAD
jgi:hypothetical protein